MTLPVKIKVKGLPNQDIVRGFPGIPATCVSYSLQR